MSTNRIAVIDDQEEVRRALAEMLDAYGYAVTTYPSAEEFLAEPTRADYACVVSDVRMPGMDGIGLVKALGGAEARPGVILISGQADVPMAVAALKAGAADFIEKPVDDVALIAAINRTQARASAPPPSAAPAADELSRFARLTPREAQVFDLIAEGHTSQSIARLFDISVRTVESYRAQAMEKLQLTSIAALVRLAVRLGRVQP
jgi:two-component system response regulator FixJ